MISPTSPVPACRYVPIPASTAATTVQVISAIPCMYFGVESLSITPQGGATTLATVILYDSSSAASGNILGQFQLGASQTIMKIPGIFTTFGIVAEVLTNPLNSDGGVNVYLY